MPDVKQEQARGEWSSRLADRVFIAACLLLGALAIWSRTGGPEPPVSLYAAGETIAAIPGVTFGGVPTVVLALSSTCRYCDASMEFYRDLIRRRSSGEVMFRMVAVSSSDDGAALAAYLTRHDVGVDVALSYADNRLTAVGTPAVLVVQDGGVVRWSALGLLGSGPRADLLKQLEVVK